MNKKGFGAACTAVLVKFRFPRISSKAWIWTCEFAVFRFFAMTKFAIFRLSNGVNVRGDFGVRLSTFVDSELAKNYLVISKRFVCVLMRSGYSYFTLQPPIHTPKITISIIVHQNPVSKVIERCALGAFEHRAFESEDVGRNLFKLVSFAFLPSASPNLLRCEVLSQAHPELVHPSR